MLVYLWMYIFIVPFNHDAQTRHTHCTWYVSCRHLLICSFSPHFSLAAFMLLLLLIKKLSCFFFCSHSLNFAYWIPIVLFYMFLCPLYFLYWQFYVEDLIKFPFNFLLPFLFFCWKKSLMGQIVYFHLEIHNIWFSILFCDTGCWWSWHNVNSLKCKTAPF